MNSLILKLGLGAAIALSASLLPQAASWAQFSDDAQENVFPSNEPGSLNGNNSFNPMDLIHRATMGTLYDPVQFRNSTERNINEAAAEFRRQRLELWQNQQAQPAGVPAETAAPDAAADALEAERE